MMQRRDEQVYEAVGLLHKIKARGGAMPWEVRTVRHGLERGWSRNLPGLPDRAVTLRELDEAGTAWWESRKKPVPSVNVDTLPSLRDVMAATAKERAEVDHDAAQRAYRADIAAEVAKARASVEEVAAMRAATEARLSAVAGALAGYQGTGGTAFDRQVRWARSARQMAADLLLDSLSDAARIKRLESPSADVLAQRDAVQRARATLAFVISRPGDIRSAVERMEDHVTALRKLGSPPPASPTVTVPAPAPQPSRQPSRAKSTTARPRGGAA